MVKRLVNIILGTIILVLVSPILGIFVVLIYLNDKSSPFYSPIRVGKNGKLFKMYKLRSMVPKADTNHVDSTKINDHRITKIGHIIRQYKIDELPQFINVIKGDMNIIGPRPNVQREVDLYTQAETKILNIRPGITDLSSIVFSDLGEILRDSNDPDIDYNQLVRPWKSRLCIFYAEKNNMKLDISIFILTVISMFNRDLSLKLISKILKKHNQNHKFIEVCSRKNKLVPSVTIGADQIVYER